MGKNSGNNMFDLHPKNWFSRTLFEKDEKWGEMDSLGDYISKIQI